MTRPPALRWSVDGCTIAAALEVVSDRSTVLVMREVLTGVRRFDDIRVRTGMPRQVLSTRLARLVSEGLLRRHPYQEPGQRPRHEYRLTEKGFDLYPVVVALLDWGNCYLAGPGGPPIEFQHRACGALVHTVLRCEAGHDISQPRDVLPHPGPGARECLT
ncbi:MAG TPA: helix-turn-helix domain-containing protein [Pseudonocardiaceae bacterium]|nr:helix-turn-helix domain-containing protein [Pseudonocardiaceae bacterium]